MTKRERQIAEVEATLDGKPRPLRPLERVRYKIMHFRSRLNSGVSIRLNPEEADALLELLLDNIPTKTIPWDGRLYPERNATDEESLAILREATRFGVGRGHQ